MDHHRCLLCVVLIGVFQLEALRQVIIHLYGTQLPTTADSILNHEVELRTIESGLTVFYFGGQALLLASLNDSLLCQRPILVGTHILIMVVRITQRDLSLEVESESCQYDTDNIHHIQELLLHLVWTTEQMGIVLSERTHTSQAMQLTTLLITIDGTKLSNAQRQVTI